MSQQSFLSTKDNPFDPFEDFDSWYMFDMEKGYDCCGKLSRIAFDSEELTDQERENEINRAIDEIIKHDFTDTFIKVTKDLNVA